MYEKGGTRRRYVRRVLKSWAAKTLPHLKEHLSLAEKLK
jgi:hypothetical protein